MSQHHSSGRRAFLRRAAVLGAAAGTPFAANLLTIGEAAAQSASDYKALVCVYLNGGNDNSNTIVPVSNAEYLAYQQARPSLALPLGQLIALGLQNHAGPPLGLHPALAPLKPFFDGGQIAIMANVGPLAVPITRAQWNRGRPTVPVPAQLTSHSDQTGAWQTGLPDRPSQTGWLGRVGDLMASRNSSRVSLAMSISGNTIMLTGNRTIQYQISTQGAIRVAALNDLYGSQAGAAAVRSLMTQGRSHLFENQLATISSRAINAESQVSSALAAGATIPVEFPQTSIGQQLQMVARLIGARQGLGQTRQVFYVSQGGYDFHDNLLTDQSARLTELAQALAAFQQAVNALGVANSVTTFTASEFGRALQHNGRGSDHGWGSHHFVMGGAVQGNRVYGRFPTVALNGPEDMGQGRLIPTTSVDEYAATLARWFGVSDSDLPIVIPNIGRFASRNLGFLCA